MFIDLAGALVESHLKNCAALLYLTCEICKLIRQFAKTSYGSASWNVDSGSE